MEQNAMEPAGIDPIRAVTERDGREFRDREKQRLALPSDPSDARTKEPTGIRVLTPAEYDEILDAVRHAVNGDKPATENR